jgi:hypothetical protein
MHLILLHNCMQAFLVHSHEERVTIMCDDNLILLDDVHRKDSDEQSIEADGKGGNWPTMLTVFHHSYRLSTKSDELYSSSNYLSRGGSVILFGSSKGDFRWSRFHCRKARPAELCLVWKWHISRHLGRRSFFTRGFGWNARYPMKEN